MDRTPMFYAAYRKQGTDNFRLLGTTRTLAGAQAKVRAHSKRFGFGGMFKDEYRVTDQDGNVVWVPKA